LPLQANISLLVERRLSLLLEDDLDEVEAAAGRLRGLLPGIMVDTFVEAHPQVLEVDDFAAAIEVRAMCGALCCTLSAAAPATLQQPIQAWCLKGRRTHKGRLFNYHQVDDLRVVTRGSRILWLAMLTLCHLQ
jgi:hypothetical protein